jgi:hypothetical protein
MIVLVGRSKDREARRWEEKQKASEIQSALVETLSIYKMEMRARMGKRRAIPAWTTPPRPSPQARSIAPSLILSVNIPRQLPRAVRALDASQLKAKRNNKQNIKASSEEARPRRAISRRCRSPVIPRRPGDSSLLVWRVRARKGNESRACPTQLYRYIAALKGASL